MGILFALAMAWRRWSRCHGQLLLMAAVTMAAYFILPVEVGKPVNWWAANLRLPAIVMLLLIPLGGQTSGWWIWHRRALAVVGLSVVFASWSDLARWEREEVAGLHEVLEAIPPGRKISTLTHHSGRGYPGIPLLYASNAYLVGRGGYVANTFTTRYEMPFVRRGASAHQGSGSISRFRIHHLPLWDGYVVERSFGGTFRPFVGAAAQRVKLVQVSGRFGYFEVRPAPPPQTTPSADSPVEGGGAK